MDNRTKIDLLIFFVASALYLVSTFTNVIKNEIVKKKISRVSHVVWFSMVFIELVFN